MIENKREKMMCIRILETGTLGNGTEYKMRKQPTLRKTSTAERYNLGLE